jgi:hypothetical protein
MHARGLILETKVRATCIQHLQFFFLFSCYGQRTFVRLKHAHKSHSALSYLLSLTSSHFFFVRLHTMRIYIRCIHPWMKYSVVRVCASATNHGRCNSGYDKQLHLQLSSLRSWSSSFDSIYSTSN